MRKYGHYFNYGGKVDGKKLDAYEYARRVAAIRSEALPCRFKMDTDGNGVSAEDGMPEIEFVNDFRVVNGKVVDGFGISFAGEIVERVENPFDFRFQMDFHQYLDVLQDFCFELSMLMDNLDVPEFLVGDAEAVFKEVVFEERIFGSDSLKLYGRAVMLFHEFLYDEFIMDDSSSRTPELWLETMQSLMRDFSDGVEFLYHWAEDETDKCGEKEFEEALERSGCDFVSFDPKDPVFDRSHEVEAISRRLRGLESLWRLRADVAKASYPGYLFVTHVDNGGPNRYLKKEVVTFFGKIPGRLAALDVVTKRYENDLFSEYRVFVATDAERVPCVVSETEYCEE